MANRGRQSAEKRRIDKLRQEQQAAKRERRHARPDSDDEGTPTDGVSEDELFERFRLLNEAHAAGKVTDEDFGPARHAIMVALGLEEPAPPAEPDDEE